jgi:hypothetical protein
LGFLETASKNPSLSANFLEAVSKPPEGGKQPLYGARIAVPLWSGVLMPRRTVTLTDAQWAKMDISPGRGARRRADARASATGLSWKASSGY